MATAANAGLSALKTLTIQFIKAMARILEVEDYKLISCIAKRMDLESCIPIKYQTMLMDLNYMARQSSRESLRVLLAFPLNDLEHDVLGIHIHMDRDTGDLQNCFVPRCFVN